MIKDKPTLSADILTFADGSSITAAQLRAYLQDILDSKLIQTTQYQLMPGPVETLTGLDVDENIVHVSNTAVEIQLPEATSDLVGRTYVHLHTNSTALTFTLQNVGDVIQGATGTSRLSSISARVTDVNEWTISEVPIESVMALSNIGTGFVIDNGDPDLPVVSVEQPDRIHVFEDAATLTSALTQNVWIDIDCNWAPSGAVKNFTHTIDTVTYTGTGGEFLVLMDVRGRMSGGGASLTQLELAVAVNGVTQPGEGTMRLDALDDNGGQLQTLVTLANGDVITPRIQNAENNNDLELHGIALSVFQW